MLFLGIKKGRFQFNSYGKSCANDGILFFYKIPTNIFFFNPHHLSFFIFCSRVSCALFSFILVGKNAGGIFTSSAIFLYTSSFLIRDPIKLPSAILWITGRNNKDSLRSSLLFLPSLFSRYEILLRKISYGVFTSRFSFATLTRIISFYKRFLVKRGGFKFVFSIEFG